MKRKELTVEDMLKRYKRRFFILLAVLVFFIAACSFYTYLNYDYLAFKHFISQNYIYTDTLAALYQKELKRDVKGKYYSYFDDFVISVVTKYIREANNDRYTYLYVPEQYKKSKEVEKTDALKSVSKALDEKTFYLNITNFSTYTRDFLKSNVGQLKRYHNLIIDLRNNYGGDIDAMVAMACMFLPRGSVIAKDQMRLFDWTYKARKQGVLYFDKIIILQNKNTASASENFIAALKDNLPNVTLIGDTTFGKGIGQFTLPLRRGFAVKATILFWYTPKGVNIQGQGIQPDIKYTGDDIVEYAIHLLQAK